MADFRPSIARYWFFSAEAGTGDFVWKKTYSISFLLLKNIVQAT